MIGIEQQMKNEDRRFWWQTAAVILFSVVMMIGCALGFLFFIRPTVSEYEKRDLSEFPEFTVDSFVTGAYTSAINTWYADTFPFRDKLMETQQLIKIAYGIKGDEISNVANGDEIPDFIFDEDPTQVADHTEGSTEETKEPEDSTEATTETSSGYVYDEIEGEEVVSMNPQMAGSVNVKDLVGYCVYGFNLKAANIYAEDVANLADALEGVCTVYDILIPNNSAIQLDDETRSEWNISDEHKVISYYTNKIKSLTDNVKDVFIYDILREHSDEYLYFKTDHHWTQLGAYYAYREFCSIKGVKAHYLAEYQKITTTNFLGSYYNSSGFTQLAENPDTIVAYIPLCTNTLNFYDDTLQTWRTGNIIRDMNEYADTVKYMGFIYGDNSLEYIENPDIDSEEVCIVIKESFGNTFVPFLADHYKKVIVVDYRAYKGSVVELAKSEKATDVIFINNLEAISDSYTMNVLGAICK